MRATRAVIHLDNLKQNLEAVRAKIGPHPEICLPVKADAYGHGAAAVAKFAIDAGAGSLAVSTVTEGVELRQAGITARVFVLSQALPEELDELADAELVPIVGDIEIVNLLASLPRVKKPLEVHLKIDTGMGRLGCRPEKAGELASLIAGSKKLRLGGIATHLSVSDSLKVSDIEYTKEQIRRFMESAAAIRNAGVDPGQMHAANSGAVCLHKESFFDMVRPGILLYGYLPARGIDCGLTPKPIMELRSVVSFIKKVRAGECVSYGREWIAPKDSFVGTIPIGYADGLPRSVAQSHSVCINGKGYPIIGRICMDQCMVDLGGGSEVERWDEAIIFGPGFLTAETIAENAGTIPYEILCNINKRVPRIYTV